MTNTELTNQLAKFARADMRKAREHGEILIAQTKQGNVTLTYSDRLYSAYGTNGLIFCLTANEAQAQLAQLYQVES